MKTIESALLVSAAALLMAQAGLAKRQLAWRSRRRDRERRRRP
jgi:hypothetical protein